MKQANRPFLIAITGGIASGKSTVSHWFEEQGFLVYYADEIGHEMLQNSELMTQLVSEFGTEILTNGLIDRAKLASFVFANPKKLKVLNSILHPAIRTRMQEIINLSTSDKLFFEIPLLFEGGLEKSFDLVINVYLNLEMQIERLVKRNHFSRTEAKKRINSQLPVEVKIEKADVNIDNNGNVNQLCNQLNNFLKILSSYPPKEVISLV